MLVSVYTLDIIAGFLTMRNRLYVTESQIIGLRVRQARDHQHLSREELGHAAGVRAQTIYRWEEQGAMPRADHLAHVAQALRVPMWWLCGVDERGFRVPPLPKRHTGVQTRTR